LEGRELETFLLLCTLLFAALPTLRAVEPMSCKEIAMLLRNGEDPQFIINETVRRKLLQPLSPEEERTLLSLHATPALMNLLHDPANVASPQAAAAYAAQVEQQKSLARLAETEAQVRASRMPMWRGCASKRKCSRRETPPLATRPPGAGNEFPGKPLPLKFDAADGSPVDLAGCAARWS
jgi:hypothetical protein